MIAGGAIAGEVFAGEAIKGDVITGGDNRRRRAIAGVEISGGKIVGG